MSARHANESQVTGHKSRQAGAGRYAAPAWLPGGHLQTIYAALFTPRPRVAYRRERWDTPDGDFIDLDWVDGTPDAPLLVLFHGLEGSSNSHYARALMHAVARQGWRGVVVHFRGCSGELNRLGRAYHSGDSAEIAWILERLRAAHNGPLFPAGVSLGGNALLKWLGEQRLAAARIVNAAAAISAPFDLMAAGNALDRGFNLLYVRHFLATMKPKSRAKVVRFPGLFDRARMERAGTLREFDNVITAPLHGFRDTDDYWIRASSKPRLTTVAVPALLLNAKNDPFLPASALPRPDEVAACVTLDFPATRGHVGFVSGPPPGNLEWLAARVLGYFEQHLVR